MEYSSLINAPEGVWPLDKHWYLNHLPPDNNPSRSTFLLGLTASLSVSTAILNEIFTNHCVSHRIWELPHPIQSKCRADAEPYYNASLAITEAVRENYPIAPKRWVEHWVRALVMSSYDQPNTPIFSDIDNIDNPFAHENDHNFQLRRSIIPLHHMTFILTVHPSPAAMACILEIVSSRCLHNDRSRDLPSEYQLSLFQESFQTVLDEKTNWTVDVSRGSLQWIRNGILETIENQHDFEVAVAQLYNESRGEYELFFLLVPDANDESVNGEDMEVEGQVMEELDVIERLAFMPPDTIRDKGKEKEQAFDYGDLEDMDNILPRALRWKGKGNGKAQKSDEIQHMNYTQWESLRHKGKEREREKEKEKAIECGEVERLHSKQSGTSSSKAKGKGNPSDYEVLKPEVYSPSEAAWFGGREKAGGKEMVSHHKKIEQLTYAQHDTPANEKAFDRAKAESSNNQPAAFISQQSPETVQADKYGVQGTVDNVGAQIEYAIAKTLDWGQEGMKKAQQRVREANKKEKEKQAEAQAQGQLRRTLSHATTHSRSVRTSAATKPSPYKQSTPTTHGSHSRSNQNLHTSSKALPTQVRQSSSVSSFALSSDSDRTIRAKSSNLTFLSTSSEALPYLMTDKERREKITRVRRLFPGPEMPGLSETENALLETYGNIDEAFVKLGGTPKKSKVTVTPKGSPMRLSGPVSTPRSVGSAGLSEKSAESTSKREASSSKTPVRNHRTVSREPSSSRTPARQQGPESRKSTALDIGLLTPPSTGPQVKSNKLSLQQRFQNAAHSAGKRINIGTPKQENDKSSNGPATPRSAGLYNMLGAFKSRGQASLVPPDAENKHYEFFVTRERAYKSGGDDENAINPLEGYMKLDEGIELNEDNEDGERLVGKRRSAMVLLKEVQNFKGLAQLTEPGGDKSDMTRWLDCCRLFRIDPNETGMRERVHVLGIKQPLFQYQAFSIYWQMINSRKYGGGFVADMPGLGKTLIFLSLIVVERQLCILWDDVNQSRRAKDGRHLPLTGQLGGEVCPSQKNYTGWIACPCVFSNPTSQMPPQPGVRIAIVPASLMSNWRAEWIKSIDPVRADLNMRLLLAHAGSVADHADTSQMAGYHVNVSLLRAKKVDKGPDIAKANQERFLVLTTAQSYDVWIEKFKYGGLRSHVMVPELNVLRNKGKYNIQFGIACVDESHEEYHIDKGRSGILARLPGNPVCWGYSGTPFDKSPRCLEGVLWAIEKQAKKADVESLATGWAQNEELRGFRREIFDKICKEFETSIKSGTTNPDTLNSLKTQLLSFLSTFMIRHTPGNRWFGHPLVAINANLHRDVFLKHNGRFDEDINALAPEIEASAADRLRQVQALWDETPEIQRPLERPLILGFNNYIHVQYKLRILATCPALIKLTRGENALALRTDELKKWRGSNEKHSPYAKNLPEIFENSPKLMWLRECILDLEDQKNVDGAEQKMIIITNFNCIAFIVKLMIEHYIPFKKGRVGLMHADLSTAARTAILEAFTDAMIDDKYGMAVRKRKENTQFLIGTTLMLSKGLQLTRACNVILMEPDHEFYRELQGYARVNRIGQRNPWTFSYRLIDDKSEVEKNILQRQKERGEFPGRVLKPGDVERMGPRDDGAQIDETGDLEQPVSWTSPKKMSTMLEPTLRKRKGVSDLRSTSLLTEQGGQGASA